MEPMRVCFFCACMCIIPFAVGALFIPAFGQHQLQQIGSEEDPEPIDCNKLYDRLGKCLRRSGPSTPADIRECRVAYRAFADCIL